MISGLRRPYYAGCYFLSWALFGVVGLLLNMGCTPLLPLRRRLRLGTPVRSVIRGLFNFWRAWFHASGVLRLEWEGFESPLPAGTIYVANHPTLLDATFVLSKLPDAICLMKPSLLRNPVVAPAALMGGYVGSDRTVDTVRDAAAAVAAGRSLLVFPEGTRTPGGAPLGPVRPGFALIAERAGAAVQLIVIRASKDLVPKGRAWWLPPSVLPAWMTVKLDRRWEWSPSRSAGELAAEVAGRMKEALADEDR